MSGNWEVGLWARPEAKPRHSDLDERRRGGVFDVLMQQADEARSRVRAGSRWQGMPRADEECVRDFEVARFCAPRDFEVASSTQKGEK